MMLRDWTLITGQGGGGGGYKTGGGVSVCVGGSLRLKGSSFSFFKF